MHIFLALLYLWLSNISCALSISTKVLQQATGNVTCGVLVPGYSTNTSLSCSRECAQSDGCKSFMFHGKADSTNKCKLITAGRNLLHKNPQVLGSCFGPQKSLQNFRSNSETHDGF